MLFLKVITTEGTTEFLNTQNILSIKPYGENLKNLKVLMGAGLYWMVKADSVEIVNLENILNIKK